MKKNREPRPREMKAGSPEADSRKDMSRAQGQAVRKEAAVTAERAATDGADRTQEGREARTVRIVPVPAAVLAAVRGARRASAAVRAVRDLAQIASVLAASVDRARAEGRTIDPVVRLRGGSHVGVGRGISPSHTVTESPFRNGSRRTPVAGSQESAVPVLRPGQIHHHGDIGLGRGMQLHGNPIEAALVHQPDSQGIGVGLGYAVPPFHPGDLPVPDRKAFQLLYIFLYSFLHFSLSSNPPALPAAHPTVSSFPSTPQKSYPHRSQTAPDMPRGWWRRNRWHCS